MDDLAHMHSRLTLIHIPTHPPTTTHKSNQVRLFSSPLYWMNERRLTSSSMRTSSSLMFRSYRYDKTAQQHSIPSVSMTIYTGHWVRNSAILKCKCRHTHMCSGMGVLALRRVTGMMHTRVAPNSL